HERGMARRDRRNVSDVGRIANQLRRRTAVHRKAIYGAVLRTIEGIHKEAPTIEGPGGGDVSQSRRKTADEATIALDDGELLGADDAASGDGDAFTVGRECRIDEVLRWDIELLFVPGPVHQEEIAEKIAGDAGCVGEGTVAGKSHLGHVIFFADAGF